ncbi:uncharacterized protein LOC123536708 [Mercenaria mercenaria]|uniref:uncharacterized protein LOC123536708 n=1 Tax=Mercenaria mercenaria TaxID=6596 RepID=UPI00234E679D|nr:uncharacterized protein LOC123536708 [Mercenaria mercenaria]
MTDYKKKLEDKQFQNWLKVALSVSIARKGVMEFVMNSIVKFHNDVLKDILTTEQIQSKMYCTTCTTDNIVPVQNWSHFRRKNLPSCPNHICDKLREKIFLYHAHDTPSWKNTCATRWCDSAWEVAKCFLPPDGYMTTDAIENTDLNGILSIILNFMPLKTTFDENSCEQARDVTRKVRHSSDLAFTKEESNEYIDTLIKFLSSTKALEENKTTKEAAENIKKLKIDALELTTDDVRNILNEQLQNSLSETRNQCIEEIVKVMSQLQTTKADSIGEILTAKDKALSEINIARISSLEEMKHHADEITTDTLKRRLKEDLLTFNWTHHTTIPLSPLFEKRDTPLESFYVEPELNAVEYPLAKSRRSDVKTTISSLHDVFNIKRCNELYITSKAGMGKTAFCKRLAFTWCQAHEPRKLEGNFIFDKDLETMCQFDFLFLISLRDCRPQSFCEIDDMIQAHVLSNLSRAKRYTMDVLQEILTQDRCLIILDGLDEWSHPKEKKCKTENDIPHRKARTHCTILTTTRTWKFCSLSLSSHQIDLHVQILGLNYAAVQQLITYTNSQLSQDDTEETKSDTGDFNTKLNDKCIDRLKEIPMILIFLICLWRKKGTIGETFCHIYTNITELLLHRAEIKSTKTGISLPVVEGKPVEKPHLFQLNDYCEKYYELLTSLGHLAFYTFFDKNRECSLVFNVEFAKQILGQYFDFCLSAGFLTQNRTQKEPLQENLAKVSFYHKTFHEYFAALYLFGVETSFTGIEEIKRICRSVDDILSVSNFYIFLCGLSPQMAEQLSHTFSKVIANSCTVIGYRSDMGSWNYFVGYNETIKKLQTVFVDCSIESMDNNHDMIEFRIEDFIIDDDFQRPRYSEIVTALMEKNKKWLKSIKIRNVKLASEFSSIVQLLGVNEATPLEKIDLKCELDDKNLECLLQGAKNTLKCFIVKGGRWLGIRWSHDHIKLSNKSLQAICNMPYLEELYLRNIVMTHNQFSCLSNYVSQKSTMKHIGLGFIRCSKHGEHCTAGKLDLSKHSQLEMLEIGFLPISEVKINTTSLEVCYVGNFQRSSILTTIFETLPYAPKLHVFCCGFLTRQTDTEKMLHTIPLLKNLKHIWLINMDLGNHDFKFCSELGTIENVSMIRIQMGSLTFRTLIKNVANVHKAVLVGLYDFEVNPMNDFEREKCALKTCKTVHVIQDDPIRKEFVVRKFMK